MKLIDLALYNQNNYSIAEAGVDILSPFVPLHRIIYRCAEPLTKGLFSESVGNITNYFPKTFFNSGFTPITESIAVSNYHKKKEWGMHINKFIGMSIIYPLLSVRRVGSFQERNIDVFFRAVLAPQNLESTCMMQDYLENHPDQINEMPVFNPGQEHLFGAGVLITDYKELFMTNLMMFPSDKRPFLSIRKKEMEQKEREVVRDISYSLRGENPNENTPVFLSAYRNLVTQCQRVR